MEYVNCSNCFAKQPASNANCGMCGARLKSMFSKKLIILICGTVLGIFLISFAGAYLANYVMYRLTDRIEQTKREEIKNELASIRDDIQDLKRQMPDSPEQESVSHDDLENKLDEIESKLGDVDFTLDRMKSDISSIESDVSSIQLKVGY